jgi:hypothetical protein
VGWGAWGCCSTVPCTVTEHHVLLQLLLLLPPSCTDIRQSLFPTKVVHATPAGAATAVVLSSPLQ